MTVKSEAQDVQSRMEKAAAGNVQQPDTSQLKVPKHLQGVSRDLGRSAESVRAENGAKDAAKNPPRVP